MMKLYNTGLRVALVLTALTARAQAPAWNLAAIGSTTQLGGTSVVQASALDASGNLLVAGYFTGSVSFGATTLLSRGGQDVFVGKYLPATNTWAWAQRAGGSGADQARAVAVSGGSIYLTGFLTNDRADSYGVVFGSASSGQAQAGASPALTRDLFVAKYTDAGSAATVAWVAVGGGTDDDQGTGVAVSGSSVYVVGQLTNSLTNSTGVLFGPSGTAVGTRPQHGASATSSTDVLLAKYTDNGSSAAFSWSQVAGGTGPDAAYGVTTTGSSVYLTGAITNNLADANAVRLGGSGTTAGTALQYGASATGSADLLLAKYTDAGATGALAWSQVAGGTGPDQGNAVAVNGSAVYVAGSLTNSRADASAVRLGGSGTTAGTTLQYGASTSTSASADLFVAKYTDAGAAATFGWSQVAGGTDTDQGNAVAVNGSAVYVAGTLSNTAANSRRVLLGGSGSTAGTVTQAGLSTDLPADDIAVVRYLDNGPSASYVWSQVGGGSADDQATTLAVSSTAVYAGGTVSPGDPITFGTAAGSPLRYTPNARGVLTQLAPATGAWQAVAATTNGGSYSISGMAPDAAGNVFVAGGFSGQVAFGSTVLSSTGGSDLFVAKYVPATGTWAWALSGGGYADESAVGLAIDGSSLYVAAQLYNNTANANAVAFDKGAAGGTLPVRGATATLSADLLLLKYTDQGSSGALGWAQVGGGIYSDIATGVAVSSSGVYVSGYIQNNRGNAGAVVFGGNGTTAGTRPQYGVNTTSVSSQTAVLAKYTDNGSTGTFGWSQVGGGTTFVLGLGVAASGPNVYMVGVLSNNLTNDTKVTFGGSGTVAGSRAQAGASTTSGPDMFLAKYTDNGSSGTLGWTQVAGGTDFDFANGVAVSGSSVYMVGSLLNNQADASAVRFGGSGLVAGTAAQAGASFYTSTDLVLAKYTDNGSTGTFGWSQVGGGNDTDRGSGVAASGGSVYVTGAIRTNATNGNYVLFGGAGTTPGTVQVTGAAPYSTDDLVLAKYQDNGPTGTYQWARTGGGPGYDAGGPVAVSGPRVYVGGVTYPPATFSSLTLAAPTGLNVGVLAGLTDIAAPLAAAAAGPAGAGLSLYPNPTAGPATLGGAAPGTTVRVLDALGRQVASAIANAAGIVRLAGLAPGLYVVRAGSGSVQLVVE
jgi:hypothetical protein